MWLVLILGFVFQVLSQPVTNGPSRQPRELIECCPCPGSTSPLARSHQLSRSSLDDCPCRTRSSDAEGSSSNLFPSSVSSDGSNMRPFDKESQKNLLEPEVGLATSMLNTLRDVTEEEYRDALARDAARAAETEDDSDESGGNLVIIVNPRSDSNSDDDITQQALHVQESRIHPLGVPLGRTAEPVNLLPDILRLPHLRHPIISENDMDSDSDASNVDERVNEPDTVRDNSKSVTSFFNPRIPLKSKTLKLFDEDFNNSPFPKSKSLLESFKLPTFPQIKLATPLLKSNNNEDPNISPSNVQEATEEVDDKTAGLFKSPQLPMLRNLWKLKDVELIPKTLPKLSNKPLLGLPKLRSSSLTNTDTEPDFTDNNYEESKIIEKTDVYTERQDGNVRTQFSGSQKNDDCLMQPKEAINKVEHATHSTSEISTTILNTTGNALDVSDVNDNLISTPFQEIPETKDADVNNNDNLQQDFNEPDTIIEPKLTAEDYLERVINNEAEGTSTESLRDHENVDQDTDTSNIIDVLLQTEEEEPQISLTQGTDTNDNFLFNEDTSGSDSEIIPQTTETMPDVTQHKTKLNPIPSLSETLSAIRENIKKLDFLNRNRNPEVIIIEEKLPKQNDYNMDKQLSNLGLEGKLPRDDEELHESSTEAYEPVGQVTFKDLQKMSNDLLSSSTNQEENVVSKAAGCNSELAEDNLRSNDNQAVLKPSLTAPVSDIRDKSAESLEENVGPTIIIENPERVKTKSAIEEEPKEMQAEASSPFINTVPAILDPFNIGDKLSGSLFKDSVVQPALPVDQLNLFKKPLDDVINVNSRLPTFDDIRDQLSNIFGTDERAAENSPEECDYDEEEIEKMAPQASTTNSQTKLPSLKPLEDLNSNLFNLNPIKTSQPDIFTKKPNINLDSYRAKVSAPKNLDIKPIRLEPSFRGKEGIQRSSLRKNTDRRPILRAKSSNKNVLGNPVRPLPTFDEIRNTLRANSEKVLGHTIQPDLSLLQTDPIGDLDNLRHNAVKTMKSLQQQMRTNIKRPQLAEPLARPQEFFEDVGDKLKAIHYDLNDRLASVHDDIFDNSKLALPTLPSPLLRTNDRRFDNNVKTNFRTHIGKPRRLQSSGSIISPQETEPFWDKVEKGINSLQAKSNDRKLPSKSLRLQATSASAPIPVITERPKSTLFLRNEPSKPVQSSIPKLSDRTVLSNLHIPRPLMRKPSFKENKVTISFGPTKPVKPVLKTDDAVISPNINTPSLEPNLKPTPSYQPSNYEQEYNYYPYYKSNADIVKLPSETKPLKLPTPVKFQSKHKENQSVSKTANSEPKLKSLINKSTIPKAKEVLEENKTKLANRLAELEAAKPHYQSKLGKENALLSRVKDAVRTRLDNNNVGPKTKTHAVTIKNPDTDRNIDMLNSASENTEISIKQEPLKENVSYKCRLVCTKE